MVLRVFFLLNCIIFFNDGLAQEASLKENVDHVAIIRSWNQKAFKRGEKIYQTMCHVCHGKDGIKTVNPLAFPFSKGTFKNGSDPFSLYKTLTLGFETMPAQAWLKPAQRYDVIHYIREQFLKSKNPSQYFDYDDEYLTTLPKFDAKLAVEDYKPRDFGPVLASRIEDKVVNGLTLNLNHNVKLSYDIHQLRLFASWIGELDLKNSHHYSLRGTVPPKVNGSRLEELQTWFWDVGFKYKEFHKKNIVKSPFPKHLFKFHGHYVHDRKTILSYDVHQRKILDLPFASKKMGLMILGHDMIIEKGSKNLKLCIGKFTENDPPFFHSIKQSNQIHHQNIESSPISFYKVKDKVFAANIFGDIEGLTWSTDHQKRIFLNIPSADTTKHIRVMRTLGRDLNNITNAFEKIDHNIENIVSLTKGGPKLWDHDIQVSGILGEDHKAYSLDTIPVPFKNPWNAWMRTSGIAFFKDGRAAISTYGGDVWIVSGITNNLEKVTWNRYASGLFEPMGIDIVDRKIYVTTRDGIKRLHDLNHNGEADFYEIFYADHDVVLGFHAFNFDLQHDSKGNFYFGKAGQATSYKLPGAILKVPPQGGQSEVFAIGVRMPNGMGMLPGDILSISDNQGPWIPASKITFVRENGFLGNPGKGYFENTPKKFDQPIIWMEQSLDNSSGGQVFVNDKRFGPLSEKLLHTSFGTGQMYYLMTQKINGVQQASIIRLKNYQFDSGIMRARVNPVDGQVYATGLTGWQGPAYGKHGCLQRLRYTGKKSYLITDAKVVSNGIHLTFNFAIEESSLNTKEAINIQQWNYLWSEKYGSSHYSVRHKGEKGKDEITPEEIILSDDKKQLLIKLSNFKPAHQTKIALSLKSDDEVIFQETMYMTIHELPNEKIAKDL